MLEYLKAPEYGEEKMTRILVVDDNQSLRDLLKEFLTTKGYEVYTADNGENALSIVKKTRPHIVFLDIIMPGMDGIECLKCIKEIDKEIGIIMITGIMEEEIANRAVELGALDYITKPFSLAYLKETLLTKLP